MTHLQDDILIVAVVDNVALAEADVAHLAVCGECQAQFVWWQEAARELAIARASTPSEDAVARYEALFGRVQKTSSGHWPRVAAWVATLVWDSRNQPAVAGIRNAGAAGYRLLYAAETREVELWVEPSGGTRTIEGEWMEGEEPELQPGVLVELRPEGAIADGVATEAGEDGRFRLDGVKPGIYQMTLTPVHGSHMRIERLEIG